MGYDPLYELLGFSHLPLAVLTHRVLLQEPGSSSRVFLSYVGTLGVCLRFNPHWMFQIYLGVTKNCSALKHSYLFPLLDVLWTS